MSYQEKYSLKSLAELKTRRGNDNVPTLAEITGLTNDTLDGIFIYKWDSTSSATNDNINVVQPLIGNGTGRWLRINKASTTKNSNTGFGTDNPLHKLVVSNNGNEGLEIAVGNGSEFIYISNYNRIAGHYSPVGYAASAHVFTEGEVTILPATVGTSAVQLQQVPVILSGSATLDFPLTLPGTSSEMTISVIGASDGDVVSVGVPNATTTINTCYTARVSATNTVTIKFNNYSAVSADPPSGLYKVKVFK